MSTFDGYFERQFGRRIRADRFTQQDPATVLQLLSHAHADHTVGLSSKDLRGYVYCSPATKDIILRSATASERVHAEINGVKSDDYYTFRNLQEPVYNAKGKAVIRDGKKVRVDVLKTLELDIRHDFSAYFEHPVAVTLIDANHCPGAVMFLIESPEHAILYTGDVRSEAFLINNLTKNPYLQDYIAVSGQPARRTLDQIYLDTSAALSKGRLLSKLEGVNEALKLIDLFPAKTRMFINCWTWGYEELLRAIAHKYRCKIHLDDYKSKIYKQRTVSLHDYDNSSLSKEHPPLSEIGTSTFQHTRFHACERRWKCPHVRGDGQGCFDSEEMQAIWEDTHEVALRQDQVLKSRGLLPYTVFINPADATEAGWAKYRERITEQCMAAKEGKGEWPTNLLVPLARHSSLPELQDLVSLFKPHNIYPNTTFPELRGHDYLLLSQYFAHTLAPGGKERLRKDARDFQQNIAASEGKQANRPTRLISSQEEEQSQEVEEELKSKFARVSSKFSEAYVTSNFDHLDNPNDLELLVEYDEETSQEEDYVEKEASQELPEILPKTSKRIVKYVTLDPKVGAMPIQDGLSSGTATPPVPSSSNDGAEAGPSACRQQKEHQSEKIAAFTDARQGLSWVRGKTLCLDSGMDEADGRALQEKIYEGGGAIILYGASETSIHTALSRADIVVCKHRDGALYRAASNKQKTIGNIDWLARCLSNGTFVNPQLDLLYQPYPSEAIEGSGAMTISSTGFCDPDKQRLKFMAAALGCNYLPELSKSQTTILISNGQGSKKNDYARKWKLPVVNFLWLEECFANGRRMPADAARYTDLSVTPESLKRRVGKVASEAVLIEPVACTSKAPQQSTVTPATLSSRPLQPATSKRKQQSILSESQESAGRCKKTKKVPKVDPPKKQDQPETFESVSTTHQDDMEKIQRVKEVVQKGLGLPRILSCDVFE